MRHADQRSFAVAIVPDALLNAPHLAGACDLLGALGYGLIQLPPDGTAGAALTRAVELALDQAQDYAAAGYRVAWLLDDAEGKASPLTRAVAAEIGRRRLALAAVLRLPGDDRSRRAVQALLAALVIRPPVRTDGMGMAGAA